MNNVRFATSLHILTLLAYTNDELLSSEFIAGSININPAVVRKEISNLRNNGLIESKEGKGGGSRLAKPASEIHISDIYKAVKPASVLGKSNTPNPACPIGKNINQHIDDLYQDTENFLLKKLENITLEKFTKKFS